jgi:hypothetical protein
MITSNEMWICHFMPILKTSSIEWKHTSPTKKKFKDIQSAENVLLTTPGMHRGIFLKFLDHRTTVNADHYCTSCVT